MLWSARSFKLHELFKFWRDPAVWRRNSTTTTTTSSLHSLLPSGRASFEQSVVRRKILVILEKPYSGQATLTQPGHCLSQNQSRLLLDMKDENNLLNEHEEAHSNSSSYKRNQVELRNSDVEDKTLVKKPKTTEETVVNFDPNKVSAYSVVQSMATNPYAMMAAGESSTSGSSSSLSLDPSSVAIYDGSGFVDPNVYYLQKKSEWLNAILERVRVWDMTSTGLKNESSPSAQSSSGAHHKKLDFKLMSYNILAQELLEQNSYLYYHCDDRVLNWEYRSANLLKEMIQSDSDILCLQEMQQNHYEGFFKPEMSKLGFESVYKKRTGDKNDGCAIFYRRSTFHLESYKTIEFNQPSVRLLDRDNVALIAVFRPILENGEICDKEDDPKLCVATTHLLFNPRRGDIKLAQLQILLAELDKVSFKRTSSNSGRPCYNPTILCGDMNSEPYSPLYKFVTKGHLNYCGLQIGDISGQTEGVSRGRKMGYDEFQLAPLGITSGSQYHDITKDREVTKCEIDTEIRPSSSDQAGQLRHNLNLLSAYEHRDSNGVPFITTQHTKARCTVDYIFYSNSKKCSSKNKRDQSSSPSPKKTSSNDPLTLLGTYRLLSYYDSDSVGGLPNAAQSSDHISLVAKFRLKIHNRS